jgi:hypothetical protein
MIYSLKAAYGHGFRFGRIATPALATAQERGRVLLSCPPPLWMGPVGRFVWRQGLRDGAGAMSAFSLFRALGW